jgi:ABC-type metal ion transport system substrate-binding protein
LDTFADPPGLAASPGVGSLRAVSSSVRAVGAKGKRPLRVGATPVPHAEILDFVREPLAARDIDLQIEIFESFDEPNDLLVAGRLHANFFQYLPFLDNFNRRTGNRLVPSCPSTSSRSGCTRRRYPTSTRFPITPRSRCRRTR